jgi:O-acetyl-ADP-ribose deacetylase (regulator of RNase III)
MRVITGDLWECHSKGAYVVIPTNTEFYETSKGPRAIMGGGLALAAAQRFPEIVYRYGEHLKSGKSRLISSDHRLILLPTKEYWRNPSIPSLIDSGCRALAKWAETHPGFEIALPALGTGLGALDWNYIRPIMEAHLSDERFVVVLRKDP